MLKCLYGKWLSYMYLEKKNMKKCNYLCLTTITFLYFTLRIKQYDYVCLSVDEKDSDKF